MLRYFNSWGNIYTTIQKIDPNLKNKAKTSGNFKGDMGFWVGDFKNFINTNI